MKRKILAFTLTAALAITSLTGIAKSADAALKGSSQSVSPFTQKTYTHSDTFDNLNIYNGIDVSKYQGDIDWEKAKEAGVEYAFIRAGYHGTAGSLQTDSKYLDNVAGATAAGIKVGLYFYTEAVNTTEAKAEANYVLELAKDYDISLPIAFDVEFSNGVNSRMVKTGLDKNKKALTNNCIAFCDTIEAAGYTSMVYASRSFLTTNIDGATLEKSYKIWVANYATSTPYTGLYEYWQYSSDGIVDGISGRVDCNFWYTSESIDSLNATSIAGAKFASVTNRTYKAKAITPTPALTLDGKKLKKGVDYRLTYSNNINIGTATIKATGLGKYKGTKTTTFKILPKKVTSFKKKSGTKQITLTWKKQSSATGYQIFRKATYNSKNYTKVKTYKRNDKITWTNTKLKNDREYYYCIRTYTTVSGKNYYSDYTYLTAPTLPGTKKATVSKKVKLYSEPTATGTVLVKVPKKTKITYLGRTYTKGSTYSFHIKYTVGGKTYKGYLPSSTKLTF